MEIFPFYHFIAHNMKSFVFLSNYFVNELNMFFHVPPLLLLLLLNFDTLNLRLKPNLELQPRKYPTCVIDRSSAVVVPFLFHQPRCRRSCPSRPLPCKLPLVPQTEPINQFIVAMYTQSVADVLFLSSSSLFFFFPPPPPAELVYGAELYHFLSLSHRPFLPRPTE